ncbi:MAG: hypothetical protein A2288_00030 [Candidatus Moranbacteria bacterium RIFOXYA12_FULL_44_15]|nr:MAG: hypothetical protein A2288_00030 [Candidatus Moranbacteria bacterium RIFOXYA12_FULL_44_15]OGI35572.1 MAG: hypothetical protein A2259_00400 [Candidatus Moranbacteria bacterium RIFOXYA2_FULL_43_15]
MSNQDHKSSDYQYLEKLKFRPELRNSFLNFFVTNFRVVLLLIMLLTALGVYSYIELPVESDPEVKIPIAVVTTVFPGASSADMEELVTKKVETEIAGLKDIDRITSSSSNSISSVTVEFNADADLDDSIRRLRDAANNVKDDLPDDANDPLVNEISVDDTPIFSVSIAGPYDGFVLREFAEDAQEELEKIPGVREVRVSGGDERELEIAYDPEKLTFYGITPLEINQIVAAANSQIPGGNFEGEKYNYSVRTDSRFFDAASLGDIPVLHGDNSAVVYLKDLAAVRDQAIKRTVYSRFSRSGAESENSVSIDIIKKTGGSIIDTADAAEKKLDEMIESAPSGMTYDITIDTANEIRKNFDQLTHDFLLTIILVFGILLLIVGLKEALVASLAIPLVFFATFGVMLYTGISLNFLSMISLILALGLLVDDAIVVVSATKQYLRTGKFTPEEAVLLVLNDFKVVLLTTTLATMWAFLPLLFSSGIMGEYIRSIPITVSVTLAASLVIALIINHPLAAVLERVRLTRRTFFLYLLLIIIGGAGGFYAGNNFVRGTLLALSALATYWMLDWYFREGKAKLKNNEELMAREWKDDELIKNKLKVQGDHENATLGSRLVHGIIHFDRVIPVYEKYLRRVLATRKSRVMTLIFITVLFLGAVAMPITGAVKSEFFPVTDSTLIFINIEAPAGLKLDETSRIVSVVEEKLLKYPEIVNFSTVVGSGGFSGTLVNSSASPFNQAQITVKLQEEDDRATKSYDLAEEIRYDVTQVQGATVSVESLSGGPPAGSAFEARILGEDLTVLDKIAQDLKPVLSSIPGVVDADISLKSSPADYTFSLDHARMELYGVNATEVGATIRMAISGTEVTEVLQDGDETKVVARFDEDKIPDLISLENTQIKNNQRQSIFLKDVATVKLEPSVDKITRVDQKRAVLLSAGVSGKTAPGAVVAEFQKKVKDYAMPQGYEIVYGGENEQNTESVQSIMRAMVIALLLIISTLVIQFNSFRKTFIVLVTIPLALIGVFYGLAIFGISLSFPGLIGVVALFGIVVKNAIILVDKINLNIKTGIPFEDSIIDAGKSRLEAIFITSICTIAGITPVTLSNETWLALGSAIVFGLLLSSFFTLFVIPTLFMMMVKEE